MDEQPPPGRCAPTGGFGRVWRGELAFVSSPLPDTPRALLGWAVEPEHPLSGLPNS